MPKLDKPSMAASLEFIPRVGQRLRRALLNVGSHYGMNLGEVLQEYRQDPSTVEMMFLRTPNCGRKTYDELVDLLNSLPDDGDLSGRVILVSAEEAAQADRAIIEAVNGIAWNTSTYQALRSVQSWLKAATVHIQQADDPREFFR